MKKLVTFILALLVCVNASAADHSQWQFTLQYDQNGIRIIDGSIAVGKKFPSLPGMKSAIETQKASVVWYQNAQVIHREVVEIPFGNRYTEGGKASLTSGVTTVRVAGPDKADSVTIELLGVATRFGVPVQGASFTQPLKLWYDIPNKARTRSGVASLQKILDTGPDANRFVIVIMGDGYLASDVSSGKFGSDAQTIISYLQSVSPWDELLKVTNIYVANVESNQAGADDPSVPTTVDTYFNTSFGVNGIDRLLAPDSTGEARAFAAADAAAGVGGWDAVLIIVNTTKYGGSGGTVGTISMHTLAPEIAIHEFGHTIGGLADEYDDAYPGFPETITEPNADTNGASPKWVGWLTPGIPLPTPEDDMYGTVIGAFEGARYKTTGVYRPKLNCKMKALGVDFCEVCKEAIVQSVLKQIPAVEGVSPANTAKVTIPLLRGKTFQILSSPFGTTNASWKLCGKRQSKKSRKFKVTYGKMTKNRCALVATPELDSSLLQEPVVLPTVKWSLKK